MQAGKSDTEAAPQSLVLSQGCQLLLHSGALIPSMFFVTDEAITNYCRSTKTTKYIKPS